TVVVVAAVGIDRSPLLIIGRDYGHRRPCAFDSPADAKSRIHVVDLADVVHRPPAFEHRIRTGVVARAVPGRTLLVRHRPVPSCADPVEVMPDVLGRTPLHMRAP
ncbi:hypothetical protein ACYOEI_30650, partial [Singulisphaera rosea]